MTAHVTSNPVIEKRRREDRPPGHDTGARPASKSVSVRYGTTTAMGATKCTDRLSLDVVVANEGHGSVRLVDEDEAIDATECAGAALAVAEGHLR
jgi:hypothetical protein